MTTNLKCPICLECIECTNNNYFAGKCGHQFHSSCIMTNVAYNGYVCPYRHCRTQCRTIIHDPIKVKYDEIPLFITEKLIQQGVTMVHLVKALMSNHEEYVNDADIDRAEVSIFEKMCIIISNFNPEQVIVNQVQEVNPAYNNVTDRSKR